MKHFARVVAAWVVAGLCLGCGGNSNADKGKNADKDRPKADAADKDRPKEAPAR